MEDSRRDLVPPTLGDVEITFADGLTLYQPDMVVLGDVIGAKIGSLVMTFRPGDREGKEEKDK